MAPALLHVSQLSGTPFGFHGVSLDYKVRAVSAEI